MLSFSGSRVSMFLLMALITGGIAVTIFGVAQRIFGWLPALLLGTIVILLPEVQGYTAMVMADNLVALLDLSAAVCFARFLDPQSARSSWRFGACAALSILCKGNGIALVLLPVLALLLTRRWELLKARAFWYPAIVVLVFAGPWQYYSSSRLAGILSSRRVGADFAWAYARGVVHLAGPAIFALALMGIWAILFRPATGERREGTPAPNGFWVAMASLLAAGVVFPIVTPSTRPPSRLLISIPAPLLPFPAPRR